MVSLSLVSDPNWPTLYARCMRETQTATARPYRNIRLDSSSYSGPRTDESPLVCSNLPGSSDVWRTSGGVSKATRRRLPQNVDASRQWPDLEARPLL